MATSNNVDECSICLSPLKEQGLDIFTTACQHQFHFKCLAKNIQAQNNECPLCRTHLDSLVNILNASSNTATSVPIQNIPIQQAAPVQTTPAPAHNTGIWGTLTRSLSNAFGWVSGGSSSRPTSSANRNNRRSIWNVSN
jgi:hypothetical protein